MPLGSPVTLGASPTASAPAPASTPTKMPPGPRSPVKKGRLTVTDRTPEIIDSIEKLSARRVYVGIPEAGGARPKGKITNAALGYIHEFGAPAANIPPRPWLVPGIRNCTAQVVERLKDAGAKAADGTLTADLLEATLNAIGMIAVASVQKKLREGPFTPLKPATLAARRRRGNNSDHPLMDTTAMYRSVRYVIREPSADDETKGSR